MVTRADVAGALKVLNAVEHKDRRGALRAMLGKGGARPSEVDRVFGDLESYPEWVAGAHLDSTPPSGPDADAVPEKSKARTSRRR